MVIDAQRADIERAKYVLHRAPREHGERSKNDMSHDGVLPQALRPGPHASSAYDKARLAPCLEVDFLTVPAVCGVEAHEVRGRRATQWGGLTTRPCYIPTGFGAGFPRVRRVR